MSIVVQVLCAVILLFMSSFMSLQLLSGCRDSDSRAQILYAECIGELGAIDPGR